MSPRGYVTSSVCANCHEDNYNEVKVSGHPYKINKVVDGQAPTYPFSSVPNPPDGFTWNDITYVIGGYGWKARFMDKDGYILTDGLTGVLVQYNIPRADLADGLPASWSAYHSNDTEPKPYNCGKCHTTGWQSVDDNGGVHFKINPETFPRDSMFYQADGKTFNKGFMTLDVVCYQCHTDPLTGVGGGKTEKTLAELSAKAMGIHN